METLEDIGQTQEELDMEFLGENLLLDEDDITEQEGFTYPAMLISGIKFNDTLRVLSSVRRNSYRMFQVWVDLGDGEKPVCQGSMQADSTALLTMKYLGLTVTLYLNKDNVEILDLSDAELIESFI